MYPSPFPICDLLEGQDLIHLLPKCPARAMSNDYAQKIHLKKMIITKLWKD